MLPLLLILLPCAIAGGCLILRDQTRLVALAAMATCAVVFVLLLRAPLDEPARLLGTSLGMGSAEQRLLMALVLALGSVFAVWAAFPAGESAVAILLMVLGLSTGAVLIQNPMLAILMLFAAALAGVMLIVELPPDARTLLRPATIAAAVKYLLLVVGGGTLLLAGYGLTRVVSGGETAVGAGVLFAGFGLWLGLVPFYRPLIDVVEETSTFLYLGVVGTIQCVALFLFAVLLGTQAPYLNNNHVAQWMVLVMAGVTAIGAPLLVGDVGRRAAAMVLLANIGQIIFVLMADTTGTTAYALTLLPVHVLGATLICAGVGLLEVHVPGRRDLAEPWRERPIAAAALVIGVLVILGVPGLSGFAGKLFMWQTAGPSGPVAVIVLVSSTITLVLASVRLLRAVLLASPEQREAERREMWRRRVSPDAASGDGASSLPAVNPAYAPLALRGWLVVLIVVAIVWQVL